jgi:Spy/CpxP family protein refolding chaperone
MNRVGKVLAWAAIAAVVSGGAVAGAQEAAGREGRKRPGARAATMPRGGGEAGLGLPLGRLNLTEAQRQEMRAIAERHQDELRQARQQLREARQALATAVRTVPLDEARIHALALAAGEAEARASVQQGRLFNELWPMLTAEQQERAQQSPERHGPRGRGGRGGR